MRKFASILHFKQLSAHQFIMQCICLIGSRHRYCMDKACKYGRASIFAAYLKCLVVFRQRFVVPDKPDSQLDKIELSAQSNYLLLSQSPDFI